MGASYAAAMARQVPNQRSAEDKIDKLTDAVDHPIAPLEQPVHSGRLRFPAVEIEVSGGDRKLVLRQCRDELMENPKPTYATWLRG